MNIHTVSNTVSNKESNTFSIPNTKNPTTGGQSQFMSVTEDILRSNTNLAASITFVRN